MSPLDNALDETSVHVLLRALRDSNAVVRRHSLHSLVCEDCKPGGCWSVDVTGVLLETIATDRSRRVRVAAMTHLLRRAPEARSVEVLRRVLSVHPHPRVETRARRVLERIERALAAPAASAGRSLTFK